MYKNYFNLFIALIFLSASSIQAMEKDKESCEASFSFSVVSWNVGDDGTYLKFKEKPQITSKEEEALAFKAVIEKRDKMFKHFFAGSKQDIYLLQEVGRELDRVQSWFADGKYGFIYDKEDSAIVYDLSRFELLEEQIVADQIHSSALLRDKESGLTIQALSTHLTGCDKHAPRPEEALPGNTQLASFLATSFNRRANIHILGADFNTSPRYQERIKIVTKLGFKADPDETGTVFDGSKIDYIMLRVSPDFTVNNEKFNSKYLTPADLKNPSDHSFLIRSFDIRKKSNKCVVM